MKPQVYRKRKVKMSRVSHLTPSMYKKLSSLNSRLYGSMLGELQCARRDNNDTHVFYIADCTGQVLSWAIVITHLTTTDTSGVVYIYTRATVRKQGLALRVIKAVDHFCVVNGLRPAHTGAAFFEHVCPKLINIKMEED